MTNFYRRSSLTILLLFLGLNAAIAQEELSLAERLVGNWRLISAESHSTDGSISYGYGKEPLGLVVFAASGRLSLHLVDPDRRTFSSGDFLRPTPKELSEAFNGYFGYFGTYSVDEAAEVVTFHIEGAAYPNYIGTDQRRFFTIDGNRLILRTPPERAGGVDITFLVTFERED